MITFLLVLLIISWVVSGFYLCVVYGEKGVDINFWSLLSVILPVVNLVFAVMIFKSRCTFNKTTFHEFIDELNDKFGSEDEG